MPNFDLDLFEALDEIDKLANAERLIKDGGLTPWQSLAIPEKHNKSGIYAIKDSLENRLYIGKTVDFEDRRRAHFSGIGNDSIRLHNAIKAEREKNGISGVADRFYWCRLLELPADSEILYKNEIEQIAKYGTYENKYHYNLTPGGMSGKSFKYKDRPEIYQDIATQLVDGKTEPEIRDYINTIYGINIPKDSIIKDMYKNPQRYSAFIDNSLIKYDEDGNAYLRNRTYRKSNIVNLYYYDQAYSDEEILNDITFKKALGKVEREILDDPVRRKLIWRVAVNNPDRDRKRTIAYGYKWIGEMK